MMSERVPTHREELTAGTVAQYLRDRGIVRGTAHTVELAGGISNIVLRADAREGSFVVKQSLEVLRVPQRWEFDRARIFTEHRCIETLGSILPAGAVPRVVDYDDAAFAFTMTLAPDGGVVWKAELLDGVVRSEAAAWAGSALGTVQARSQARLDLRTGFEDTMPLEQGRIEPYHLATARRHPDLVEAIQRDVHRLRTDRRVLVLGDFSPKNILVYSDHLVLLDFEVAHWGDPAFDPAFLLSHLLLKGVHRPDAADAMIRACDTFWAEYRRGGGLASEQDVAAEAAVLLLCRVDGKSPVEYLTTAERGHVRTAARRLVAADRTGFAELADVVKTWEKEKQ